MLPRRRWMDNIKMNLKVFTVSGIKWLRIWPPAKQISDCGRIQWTVWADCSCLCLTAILWQGADCLSLFVFQDGKLGLSRFRVFHFLLLCLININECPFYVIISLAVQFMSITTTVELPVAILDHAASSLYWQSSKCSRLLPGVSRTGVFDITSRCVQDWCAKDRQLSPPAPQ
jgi:hypothetical protein